MKTVCPHCNQEYDVENNFLQQEVTCTVCNQNFTVNKAKFCADCGTVNPAQAFKCRQCGKNFPLPQMVIETSQKTDSAYRKQLRRVSSAKSISRMTKWGFDILILSLFVPLIAIIWEVLGKLRELSTPGFGLVLLAFVLSGIYLAGILPALVLVQQLGNANVKIVWSTYKKISMSIATAIWIGIFVFWIIDAIKSPSGLQIGLLITSLLSLFAIPSAWQLIRIRAQEDMDFEPDQETVAEENMNQCQRECAVFAVIGLCPILGIPFCIIAIMHFVRLLRHRKSFVKLIPHAIFILIAVSINIGVGVALLFQIFRM